MALYPQQITSLAYCPGFGGMQTFLLYINIVARLVDIREPTSDFLFSNNIINGFCLVRLFPLIHSLLLALWMCTNEFFFCGLKMECGWGVGLFDFEFSGS